MLSDYRIAECECLFLLIDNHVIKDDLFNMLMMNLMVNENECYIYIMWLLSRWIHIRKHKFEVPSRKKDVYCTNCGFSILISQNYCSNCGSIKYNRYINLSDVI